MSTDLQDLLREGLDRLTAGATAPDGLVGRAQQHNRQRRTKIRAAIAAGTAVAAAAAAVTVSLAATGSKPGSAPVHTQTIADVATRTERALVAAIDKGKAIQVERATGRNLTFGLTLVVQSGPPSQLGVVSVPPDGLGQVTAQQEVTWRYRDVFMEQGLSASGRLVYVNSNSLVAGPSGKRVPENYGAAFPARIRWRTAIGGVSGPGPGLNCQNVPSPYPSWPASITKALSCGLFTLGGRQQMDGVNAMTLLSRPQRGEDFRLALWVNPATYLPVRMSVTYQPGSARAQQLVYDFRFLPPTPANLAQLRAAIRHGRIPASFRRLPSKYLVLAGGNGR